MNKIIIGLIGQICTGKSAVAVTFRSHGAMVWDADRAIHNLYQSSHIAKDIAEFFPDCFVNGNIDRKKLASIVFSDPAQLKKLTDYMRVHTGVIIDQTLKLFKKSSSEILVLDAPTLFEYGRIDVCDYVIFVEAPLKRRQKWAKGRGWTEDELVEREQHLAPEADKRKISNVIINNNGTAEELGEKVEKIYAELMNEGD